MEPLYSVLLFVVAENGFSFHSTSCAFPLSRDYPVRLGPFFFNEEKAQKASGVGLKAGCRLFNNEGKGKASWSSSRDSETKTIQAV
jgi:hypothetical protein